MKRVVAILLLCTALPVAGGEKATQAVANVVTGLLAGCTRSMAHYEASTTPEACTALVTRYGLALESAMMSVIAPGFAGSATGR